MEAVRPHCNELRQQGWVTEWQRAWKQKTRIAHGICPAHITNTNSKMSVMVLAVRTANFDILLCFGDASPAMVKPAHEGLTDAC